MVKIAITDDHEIFLKGLERLFSSEQDFEVVASFQDGTSLLNAIVNLNIDVLLLDIQLPDYEPEKLLKKIRKACPTLPILYLTMFRGTRLLHRLEKHEIQGYILKDVPFDELRNAIQAVGVGEKYFNQIDEQETLANTVTIPENKLQQLLSPREYEILRLVCKEYSSAEIGEQLFLSTGTVDTHRRNILVKLGVHNTVGMVKFALQNGILNEED